MVPNKYERKELQHCPVCGNFFFVMYETTSVIALRLRHELFHARKVYDECYWCSK